MNQPKLSLILVIDHNQNDYIRILEQAQSQDYSNIEIIVISNRVNTKDQIILDFLVYKDELKRSSHLSFLKREHLSSLYNEGISCATGDYIWCIDKNVILDDNKTISNIIERLVQSKAQALYLQDTKDLDTTKIPGLNSEQEDSSVKIPLSLVNEEDWHNCSRLVLNRKSIRLFNLHLPETCTYFNGALFTLQIIRFLPNIYYYPQGLVKFEEGAPSSAPDSREFAEHKLALNYTLRYSEILFGVNSNPFKTILKREIKDTQSFVELIDSSKLNQKAKDFIKYSRSICLTSYIEKTYIDQSEKRPLLLSIKSLTENIKSRSDEMLSEIFKHSRIKVHCGAHKTATTYIQNILFEARYDLALQNTIFIHHDQLREDFIKARQEIGNADIGKRLAYAICKQAANLAFGLPSMLIISEENLIRPSQDIFSKWISADAYHSASNYSCACMRNGYDLSDLEKVSKIFEGRIEIIYTVRNYFDYLLSRHSEFLKWRPFKEFDGDFVGTNDLAKCDWKYLLSDLKKISAATSISCFEDYKNDPLKFANYLSEADLSVYENKVKCNQEVNRSRASQDLLDDLINKNSIGFNKVKLKEIFVDKIDSEISSKLKFKSKLFSPKQLEKSYDYYRSIYLSKYAKHLDNNLDLLSSKRFSEVYLLENLQLPERAQLSLEKNSSELKSYLNDLSKRFLYLDNRGTTVAKEPGISAMIRLKNEEDNIYNVLNSIKNCFDEIVIVDNDSADNTISEIKRAVNDHPLLKAKIKLHHYKFNIARCGLDNFIEPQNSPNSLASFYNYSLKKCNFSKVCKWDGDMFLPKSMEKSFQDFLKKVLKTKSTRVDSTVFGVMKGLTVFKGANSKFYCRQSAHEFEARIFDNIPGVFFVKEILWEQIFSLHSVERLVSEDVTFVEFKDTSINEFSHWSAETSLGMSPRKDKELRDFNLIKKITQNKNYENIDKVLLSHGFREIDFDLFDFNHTPLMLK
ncbi:glycosyl transferase 2 family protein [Synechococcus sp. RS9907]|uniref:glycosyltransferase family 2 protein n=1 Tax=Synechococcus sp. RS9907 TaxID=221350 RepID=UPI00165E6E58|nr:glycosyltransferase family 2 protein [Synechococcus sp. RS9907]QNI83045.1 glycosyl transferase 2 family protein [Synechococcus sp. RS9907]